MRALREDICGTFVPEMVPGTYVQLDRFSPPPLIVSRKQIHFYWMKKQIASTSAIRCQYALSDRSASRVLNPTRQSITRMTETCSPMVPHS